MLALAEVVSTDIDEVRNRLAVGIKSESRRARAAAQLRSVGIPKEAVIIEVAPSVQLASHSLAGRVRSVVGGVRTFFGPGALDYCTLGFNGTYNGVAIFATNGHCTTNMAAAWGVAGDGGSFYQIDWNYQPDFLGNETYEETWKDQSIYPSCPTGRRCKYTDIAMGRYRTDGGIAWGQFWLARPTTRVQFPGAEGNLTIDDGQLLLVTDEYLAPVINQEVDKIGSRTGWTFGPVTRTCFNQDFDGYPVGPVTFLCSYEANGGVNGGDSGSAVFLWGGGSNVTLTGQLFGGRTDNTHFIFSPWNNIQGIMGNIVTTPYGY